LEDERLKKIAEDKRHTDERHQLAAEICTSIAQAPMTAAAALVDWMERNPAREWDMRSLRRRLDSALLSSQLEQLETKR
jgi:hypothetical protein